MKLKRKIINGLLMAVCLFHLSGCSHSTNTQAANVLNFNLNNVTDITISYDEEAVTFFQSDNDELIIKEYMTENKSRYYADVKQDNGNIHVSEGWKPFFNSSFTRYVEVYLPQEYQANLTVTTTDGNIDMSNIALTLNSLRIDSTAGTVQLDNANATVLHLSSTSGKLDLGNITGEQIKLDTTSGKVICEKLNGAVTYTSTSGDIDVKSAIGAGSYRANNSGKLNVSYTDVTGDLSFFNKNDNIELTLPQDLEFEFEATTKNGSVSTSFQDSIRIDGRTARGTVGNSPTVTVKTETNNGNIVVTQ
ncbi:DUF4097 domain-containing protein [Blautia schinkii]|nr:DUF4097 domain-containing protein [Blautia schinkii]